MYLDLIFSIILIYCIFQGMKRGALLSAFYLFGLVISAICAKSFTDNFYEKLLWFLKVEEAPRDVASNSYIYSVAYYLTLIFFFFIFYILLYVIIHILRVVFKKVRLSWIDYVAGSAFGLFKGFVTCSLIYATLVLVSQRNERIKVILKDSQATKYIPNISRQFYALLPEPTRIRVEQFKKEISLGKFLDSLMDEYDQNEYVEQNEHNEKNE